MAEVELFPLSGSPLQQEGLLPTGWVVRVLMTETPTGPVVDCMQLRNPEGETRQVTAEAWRKVPVGAVIDAAKENYRAAMEWAAEANDEPDPEWIEAWATLHGPKGHPDELYAQLARRYCFLMAIGRRNPVEELATGMGVGRATASQRLQTARSRDLLDGAELTPKAKKLLGVPTKLRGF